MTEAQLINAVLNRLRSNLGLGENPPGSNHNFITDWYNQNVDRIGNGPWCEMTATWSMWTGGARSLKTGRAYTVWAAEDAQQGKNGSRWNWGVAGMRAGDQVYYDWNGVKGDVRYVDHVGTVEKVNGDGTFYALEGNMRDQLRRVLRDSKYVVGYVRFDWARLLQTPPSPTPVKSTKPVADRNRTRSIQQHLEVPVDGLWGKQTDARALFMRNVARAKIGWPKNVPTPFNVRTAQAVIDTSIDGKWGPNSQAALMKWVRGLQDILHVEADGFWGPKTDNAFLVFRKQNFNNF